MNHKTVRNFLRGMGSIVEIYPTRRNYDKLIVKVRRHETDLEALRSDWERIGQDMQRAIDIVSNERRRKESRSA